MQLPGDAGANITVAVVDDDRQLCELLVGQIGDEPDLHCVGAVHTIEEAERLVASEQPSVILADLLNLMPGYDPDASIDGIGELARLSPASQVLVWTAWINWGGNLAEEYRIKLHAHEAGASDWVPKDNLASLLDKIRAAAARGAGDGTEDASPLRKELGQILDQLVRSTPSQGKALPGEASLTPTETQVIPHLAYGFEDGYSVSEIAARIGMNPSTLEKHKKNVYAKWDVHSQPSFIKAARLRNFL